MSFYKLPLLIFSGLNLLFFACQDTQKKVTKQEDQKPLVTKLKDSLPQQSEETTTLEVEKSGNQEDTTLFKLTNKNMREFLTIYGKENQETKVRVSTKFGAIDIRLYKETPLHRANFLYLTKQKYFDETFFYRVAKDFVIQGGNSDRDQMAHKRFEIGDDYTIPQEQIPGKTHKRGSVALSKQWVDNPSNRSTPFEFFIVVAKNGAHHLDGEHTIFGEVISGMDVVDQINKVPVDSSEWPKENIDIKVEVLE
ncbi:peptidylprolyl isomerase [Aquimarina sp. ERC-38]|uniref:peptidylprolyl isomerase n=1 Tax=Aquimarina sp. ERC-38 TaxID=2949996 RepID=UPI00224676FB|nr:peptidylprolyl isomerase [Aquimarina sp. ERC-38]UZO80338.1 peptidylprolyl isomerase [Aquimarina sp. ERC-38]